MGKGQAYHIKCTSMSTAQKLKKLEAGSQMAIKRTISDLRTRSNAQIKAAIQARYGVNATAINKAKKRAEKSGKIRVSGILVDGLSLPYKGNPLTLTHFSMTPRSRHKKKPYQVTATIKDGKTATFPRAFLGKPSGTSLPFQRQGQSRYPLEVIHTLSVPQMISNEQVAKDVEERIAQLAESRLEHHTSAILDSVSGS